MPNKITVGQLKSAVLVVKMTHAMPDNKFEIFFDPRMFEPDIVAKIQSAIDKYLKKNL
jgi:hypothetical protein